MIPLLAAGLMAGGGILQGLGAYQQGQFQGALSDFNSRQLSLDAQIAQQNADAKAKALMQGGARLMSKQKVGYSKAGLRLEGTPLEVLANSYENVQLDAISTQQAGRFESAQLKAQSKFQASMADSQRTAGKIGLVSGLLSGGAGAAMIF